MLYCPAIFVPVRNFKTRRQTMIKLNEEFNTLKLIKFTLPTILMTIFTSIYGIVDGLFISNIINSNAFASINLIMPFTMILGAIGFMFGTGGSALVSKVLGEKNNKKARQYFSMIIYSAFIIGIVLAVIGFIFIKQIANLLGAKNDILDMCIIYGRLLMISLPFLLLQNSFQSFTIVEEKPKIGLTFSIISGVSNIILDYLLIYLFRLGIFGAGMATMISQIIGAIIPFIYFTRSTRNIKLVKTKIILKPIFKACTNGLSEMVSNISYSIVNILFNLQVIKYIGIDGVVAYGIINYVSFIFISGYLGFSNGAIPIIAYHYGANNKQEIKRILKLSIKILFISSIFTTILAEILSKPMVSIFVSNNSELMNISITAFRLFSISYIIDWFNLYASSFFTALNDGKTSAIISLFRAFVGQIIMILILPIILGINGLWLAATFAELISLGISLLYFIKYKEKYL